MFLLFAFLVATTAGFNLTCHCQKGSACSANGFCASNCEASWSGPGCQVGNIALRKVAKQSTTYTDTSGYVHSADLAVNGNLSAERFSPFCTQSINISEFGNVSYAKNDSAWWAVTLSTTSQVYFIKHITLYGLHGQRALGNERLTNFVILYSNDTERDPDPNDINWKLCAAENGSTKHIMTYTCNSTAIAKRVAVFLTSSSSNTEIVLELCEVEVIGYEYYECPSGYAGPGCLLRSCDKCVSTNGKCTGEFGIKSCIYDVCPDQLLLPPYCWMTLFNINELIVSSIAACNSIQFSATLPDTQSNIAVSSLQLQVTTNSNAQMAENVTLPLIGNNTFYYKFATATPDSSYNVSVKGVYCYETCFTSTGSKLLTLRTGKREYAFSHNTSCVFVHASSMTLECETPSSIEISCKPAFDGGVTVNSLSSPVCGLESGQGYNCSVAAIIDARTIERQSEFLLPALSNASDLIISSTAACNSIGISVALSDIQRNIAASWLQLLVSTSANPQVLENVTLSFSGNNSVSYNFTNATTDTSYNISLTRIFCFGASGNCFSFSESKVLTLNTGKREYIFSRNTGCLFVHARSMTTECEPPSAIEISCKPAVESRATVSSSSSPVCGLESGQAYNCTVGAIIDKRRIETKNEFVLPALSNASELIISATAACNSIRFSAALSDIQRNIAASSLQLQVSISANSQVLEDATLSLQENNSFHYQFANATTDTSYIVSLKLVYCFGTTGNCFHSGGSKVLTLKTGKREYLFSRNTSCVFVQARYTTPQCETPPVIEISCKPAVEGAVALRSSSSSMCGLKSEQAYNCSVEATIAEMTIERRGAFVLPEPLPASAVSEKEYSVLAGSIGGSIAVTVIIVAIIVIVCCCRCRRKRNNSSHASAIGRDTKASGPGPARALDATNVQSFNKEQNENANESLHKELQTTGHYVIVYGST